MNKQGWPSEVVAEFEIAYIIMQGAPSILMNVKQVAVLLRTRIREPFKNYLADFFR